MRVSTRPILAARRRRQLHPFFFRMGPVGLCMCSVLLISLMAVLYLSQLGQAVSANQDIQSLHRQQAILARQDQDLALQIAQEQSPTYIAPRAKAMGLVPSDPKAALVIVIAHLKSIRSDDQHLQP